MITADTQLLQVADNLFSSDKNRRGSAATVIVELIYLHDTKQGILQSETLRVGFQSAMQALAAEADPDTKCEILAAIGSLVSALRMEKIEVDVSPIANSIEEYDDDQLYTAISVLSLTRDVKYIPLVSRYLDHSHEDVRDSAAVGLQILRHPA